MGDTNTSSSSALDVTADTALSEGGGANSCLPKRPFLARLTLDVSCERGGSLALVGASGSGKSTATRLLLRLVEADAGAIRVAGVPVRQICQSCLRRFVGCACAARAGDCSCWWLFKFTTLPHALLPMRPGKFSGASALAVEACRRARLVCLRSEAKRPA